MPVTTRFTAATSEMRTPKRSSSRSSSRSRSRARCSIGSRRRISSESRQGFRGPSRSDNLCPRSRCGESPGRGTSAHHYCEEVTAILEVLADLNVHVRRILDLLQEEFDGEEEEG